MGEECHVMGREGSKPPDCLQGKGKKKRNCQLSFETSTTQGKGRKWPIRKRLGK